MNCDHPMSESNGEQAELSKAPKRPIRQIVMWMLFIFALWIGVFLIPSRNHLPKTTDLGSRVFNPDGYSILMPHGWKSKVLTADMEQGSLISLRPNRKFATRSGGQYISVERYTDKPMKVHGPDWDMIRNEPAHFQGRECPTLYAHRNWTGDENSMTEIIYFIEMKDCWFRICYGHCGFGNRIPDQVIRWLETFQRETPTQSAVKEIRE